MFMGPTGFINPPMARECCRIGSALFNQRPGTEARISALLLLCRSRQLHPAPVSLVSGFF